MAEIKVNIDVNSGDVTIASDRVLTLREQVKILTKELQRPQSPEAFNAIKNKLNETQDSLSKVTTKSKELFGTLSTIPGPIGQISSAIQGGIDLLKTFSGFTFKDVKNSFKELGKDIGEIAGNITGTSEAIATIGTATPNVTALAEATGNVATATGDAANASAQAANTTATLANATAQATNATVAGTAAIVGGTGPLAGYTVAKAALVRQLAAGTITIEAYNIALAQMAAGETVATGTTTALAVALQFLQATGILIIIAGLAIAGKKLYDYVFSTKEAESATRQFTASIAEQQRVLQNDLTALDSSIKLNEARAKAQGASETQLYLIQKKGGEDRLALLRDYDRQLYAEQDALAKNEKVNAEDRIKLNADLNAKILKNGQDINKLIIDNETLRYNEQTRLLLLYKQQQLDIEKARKDALKEIRDAEKEYALSQYDDREREIREVTDQYIKLINLAAKYNQDDSILKAQRREAIDAINEKYDIAENERAKKARQEIIDFDVKVQQDAMAREEELQAKFKELRENALENERNINQARVQSQLLTAQAIGDSLSSIAGFFEEGTDLQKTFAILSVLVSAAGAIGNVISQTASGIAALVGASAQGTAAALAGTAMFPLNPIQGAALIASGTAAITGAASAIAAAKLARGFQIGAITLGAAGQIAAITSKGKSNTSSSTTGGGSQSTVATPAFSAPTIGAPQIGPTSAQEGTIAGIAAGTMAANQSSSRPLRAYVVGNDITTEMQLQRRLRTMARLGG
jgi:hypothetical protein